MYLSASGDSSSTFELLLDCVTAPRRDEARGRLHARLAGPVDWDALLIAARRHGVAPLVYLELRAAPAGLVPPDALARLQTFYLENTRRCLLLTGWLRRAVDALEAAGVQAIPYKGPVLAALAYGSIASRQAGDLDILIDPGSLAAAREALRSEGFQPLVPLERWQEQQLVRSAHPYALVREPESIVLELHWSVSPRSLSAGLGGSLPREQREEVAVAGTTFPTLPADVLLVALCVHGAKHAWERLGWIVDVAALIRRRPGLDWAGVARPRRRGGPPARAPPRLPPGARPPRHPAARGPDPRGGGRCEASGARPDRPRPARPSGSRPPRPRRDGTVSPRGPRNLARPSGLLPLRDDADRGRLDGGPPAAVARAAPLSPAGGAPAPGRGVPRSPLTERRRQGIRRTLPVVRRPSRSWCARVASASGNVAPMRSLSSPFWIQPRTSPARRTRSSRDAV